MDNKTLEMTMLFDFYGELLTEKQRMCFSLHWGEDLSLSEIADIMHISRQGVRDLLVRAEATLTETEKKIGLVSHYKQQLEIIDHMEDELNELSNLSTGRAKELTRSLFQELDELKK